MNSKGTRPELVLARRGGAVEWLRLPAFLMGAVTSLRNWMYDLGLFPARRLELPIVSVGNVTAGGTGKTPMVILLLRDLMEKGYRPGVLSRGYHSKEQNDGAPGLNDEGRLFDALFPGLPQVQMPDRVRGALQLERLGADVIVLDDGFQHRRLARDVDLVLVDATRPWGLPASEPEAQPVRALLPRGLLRERLTGLGRASAIVITRSDSLEPEQLQSLESELQTVAPGVVRLLGEHRPVSLLRGQERLNLSELDGHPVQLVSGIGNPEAFERTARAAGARILGVFAFPDHHAFSSSELEEIRAGGELLVTSKDSVKLEQLGIPHLVLEVAFEVTRGERVLDALLDALPRSQKTIEREALHGGLHG